jgi:hypothetical protein
MRLALIATLVFATSAPVAAGNIAECTRQMGNRLGIEAKAAAEKCSCLGEVFERELTPDELRDLNARPAKKMSAAEERAIVSKIERAAILAYSRCGIPAGAPVL